MDVLLLRRYYRQMILDYIKQFGKTSRADVRGLVFDKLSDVMSIKQKEIKIRNIPAISIMVLA